MKIFRRVKRGVLLAQGEIWSWGHGPEGTNTVRYWNFRMKDTNKGVEYRVDLTDEEVLSLIRLAGERMPDKAAEAVKAGFLSKHRVSAASDAD